MISPAIRSLSGALLHAYLPAALALWIALLEPADTRATVFKGLLLGALASTQCVLWWTRRRADRDRSRQGAKEDRDESSGARLAELNCELSQVRAELERARERAVSGGCAAGELLGDIDRETLATLNAIIGMSQLLLGTPLDPAQRDHAQTVQASAESLLGMLEDVIDRTHLEAGDLVLDDEQLELDELVWGVLDVLDSRAVEKEVELTCFVSAELARGLVGDRARLRRVLLSLLALAIDGAEGGRVDVRVESLIPEQGRALAQVQVDCGGPGQDRPPAAEEEAAKLSRALATARRLAECMGGELTVGADSDRGLCLRLSALLSQERSAARPAQSDLSGLAGKRALIVEARAESRWVLGEMLELVGIECGEAGDGSTALNVLRRAAAQGNPYALALVSERLADADGERLCKKITRNAVYEDTRVLLVGRGATGAEGRGPAAGAAAALRKPVRQTELHRACGRALGLGRVDPGPGAPRFPLDVLVVEDDLPNQKFLRLSLERLGCSVDVTADGAEAAEAVGLRSYDLLLISRTQARPERPELEQELAALREAGVQDLPWILFSTRRTAPEGVDQCLRLPIRIEDLARALARVGLAPTPGVEELSDLNRADEPEHPLDVLDAQVLASLRELSGEEDPDLFEELVQIFLRDTPPRLRGLQEALQARDWKGLEVVARNLKSSCVHLGAQRLSSVCVELERLCREDVDADRAAGLVRCTLREFELAKQGFEALDS